MDWSQTIVKVDSWTNLQTRYNQNTEQILNKNWTKTEQKLNKYLTNTEQYWTNLQTIYHQNTHRGPLVDNTAATGSNLTKLFQFPKEEQMLTIWFNFDMILKQFYCFGFQKKSQLT